MTMNLKITVLTAGLLAGCATQEATGPHSTDSGSDDPEVRADAAAGSPDAASVDGTVPDLAAEPEGRGQGLDQRVPRADLHPKPTPDAAIPIGGKLVLSCPSSGFHQPPPIEISSLPPTLLPRCSQATKTCVANAATYQATVACLTADTTPPATFDGEPVNCRQCDLIQGSYCLAAACPSEFAVFGCCSQATGTTCQAELGQVTTCAATTAKAAYEGCLLALVSLCLP
jgi:hypothetical protein